MEKDSLESSSDVIALLQEQNQLLKQLLDVQKKDTVEQKRREWFMIGLKMLPYILIAGLLLWIYFSVSAYLAELNSQITEIRTNIDGVFKVLSDQYEFLKAGFGKLGDALSAVLPGIGGMAEKVKDALPKF
ncbi:MAG TPA: hypothetical protein VI588_04200 [Candidatus Gracilibacteria bacterium]|nr:hypothetical protein [Candidatus Gracilibacteria bacterium]